jgi:hypothetical protein
MARGGEIHDEAPPRSGRVVRFHIAKLETEGRP